MTEKATSPPWLMPPTGVGHTRSKPVFPGKAFMGLGITLSLIALSIIACKVASTDFQDFYMGMFDFTLQAGFLNFIAGFLATMTGCKSKRGVIIATLVMCCVAMVVDATFLASSARANTRLQNSYSNGYRYDGPFGYQNSQDNNTVAINIAFIVLSAISFIFLLALSILGCKGLRKETEEANAVVVYGVGADRTPLIQMPQQLPPMYAQ